MKAATREAYSIELEQDERQTFYRRLLFTLALSLLIHVGLSLFIAKQKGVLFHQVRDQQVEEVEKRLEFELVDVPEDAEPLDKQVKSNFISDRSARARDLSSNNKLPIGEPMSPGKYSQINEFQSGPRAEPPPPPPKENMESKETVPEKQSPPKNEEPDEITVESPEIPQKTQPDVDFEQMEKEFLASNFSSRYIKKQKKPPRPQRQRPLRKHTTSRAPNAGGFALNTYDWTWAPYLKEMKKKIEQNLFVPEAFRRYGMISGQAMIRFKVLRNGQVKDLEVLRYSGHESLMQSSVNSVKGAQPFRPLPDDFPQDMEYLEITASYFFATDRNKSQKER